MPRSYAPALNSLQTRLAQVLKSLPDSLTVMRDSSTAADAFGKEVPNYNQTVVSGVPCIYRPASGREPFQQSGIQASAAHVFTVPAYWSGAILDVNEKDRLIVAARGSEPQRTFEIAGILRNGGATLTILASLEGS